MSALEINLFGFPGFRINGQNIRFERRKTIALIAYLAVENVQPGIGRESLASLFWPECSQEQAGAYLRQALWDFTRAAGDGWLTRHSSFVGLDFSAGIQVDTRQFESLFAAWQRSGADAVTMECSLEDIVTVYRDHFLAGFTLRNCPGFDDWQTLQSETYRLHLAQALEALTALKMTQKEWDAAGNHARRWSSLDALEEAPHRALMRIYQENGQHSAALRQFEQCRLSLMDELGVEPGPETQALYRQISALDAPGELEVARTAANLPRHERPSGTVTFVFTDIEGSTHLWEHQRGDMQRAFDRQESLIRAAMAAHDGYVYKMIGDAFQVAFSTAPQALAAVVEAQRALHAADWGKIGELKVRMALHTGVTEERGDDYVGPALNRVARLLSAGHGGQVLVSQAVYDLMRDALPEGIALRYLGEFRLKDLVQPERIYQLEAAGLPAGFPPLKVPGQRVVKLPAGGTPFIGREAELSNIQEMLADPDCRLITLVGMGGSGKTRLAARAGEVSAGFPDGVYFVPLAQSLSREDVVLAITEAVEFKPQFVPRFTEMLDAVCDQLFQYLRGRQILLVMDNFEHLIDHGPIIRDLLDAVPTVKVIATSRQRLNLSGEWVVEVGGLSFPVRRKKDDLQQYAAIQLFLKTAERASGFSPSDEDWPELIRICQMIEGIPLGLEMAASWTRMLTCQEIATEIEQNLDFLSAAWRGMPERQRTLRAVFEYSWDLLTEEEQDIFRRLAIFKGSFNREAASQVARASLPVLSAFIDQSFIRRLDAGRYEIHPLLRQYAYEKLSGDPDIYRETRAREEAYYSVWLVGTFERLKEKEYLTALAALRQEALNISSTLQWQVEQLDVKRLSKELPVWILYHVMNDQRLEMQKQGPLFVDLADRLRPFATTPDAPEAALLALSLAGARQFLLDFTNVAATQSYLEESLMWIENAPDHLIKAYTLLLDSIGPGNASVAKSLALNQQCIVLFQGLKDTWGTALAQLVEGDLHCFIRHDAQAARADYDASLAGFSSLQCEWGRALSMFGLMHLEKEENHLDEAYRMARATLEIYTQMGNYERMIPVRHFIADLAEGWGFFEEASDLFQENLAHYAQRGDAAAQNYYRGRLEQIASKRHA